MPGGRPNPAATALAARAAASSGACGASATSHATLATVAATGAAVVAAATNAASLTATAAGSAHLHWLRRRRRVRHLPASGALLPRRYLAASSIVRDGRGWWSLRRQWRLWHRRHCQLVLRLDRVLRAR